jgi:hypothetical protein
MSRSHPALQGVYHGRKIDPGDLSALVRGAERKPRTREELSRAYAVLYDADFEERAQRYDALRQDRQTLALLEKQHQANEIESFRFQGRRYDSADAKRLLKQFDRLLDEEAPWWADFDRRVLLVHFQMSLQLGEKFADEVKSRYEFHLALQDLDRETSRQRWALSRVSDFVDEEDGPMDYRDFHDVRAHLLEAYDSFERCLRSACRLKAPRMECLPAGQPLANILLTQTPVPRLKPAAQALPARWIHKFGKQLDEVRVNLRTILAESLGDLLNRQAWIAHRWTEDVANCVEIEEEAVYDDSPEGKPDVKARNAVELAPLDEEDEEVELEAYVLSEEDLLSSETKVEVAEVDEPLEFELSEQDVLAGPEEIGEDVELDDIDEDDHNNRPRHWGV